MFRYHIRDQDEKKKQADPGNTNDAATPQASDPSHRSAVLYISEDAEKTPEEDAEKITADVAQYSSLSVDIIAEQP